MTDTVFDGVFTHRYAQEDGLTYREMKQPTEDLILEHNKELRKNDGALLDLGHQDSKWGRQIADIPMVIYEAAIRAGFDFNNPDKRIRKLERDRFLATPIGKACMVIDENKHSLRNQIITG